MQYKVPQNIDMEDKIIGPLSLSQFFYLLFGGIIIYILFHRLALTGYYWLFLLLSIPIGVVAFAFAFVKVQDRPFAVFAVSFFRFSTRPKERVWHHRESTSIKIQDEPVANKPDIVEHKNVSQTQISELANVLDSRANQGGESAGESS